MRKFSTLFIKNVKIPMPLRRILPKKVGQRLKLFKRRISERSVIEKGGTYHTIHLTSEQIKRGEYMKYIGGGSREWDERGEFQLKFMKKIGLKKYNTILDYGCGPIRAGKHFIKYLNSGNYFGIDYNKSFIEASKYLVEKDFTLKKKKPLLLWFQNFNLERLEKKFNFILLFSVLNHCNLNQRKKFFKKVIPIMNKKSLLVISHAHWFNKAYLPKKLFIFKKINKMVELETLMQEKIEGCWESIDGWGTPELMLPILFFKKR